MRQEAAAVRESAAKPSAQSVPKSLYSISAARTVPRAAGRQGSK
jgi:hypothetical protein